jgi:hypothetical protein
MSAALTIELLDGPAARVEVDRLAALLVDSVEGGASLGFSSRDRQRRRAALSHVGLVPAGVIPEFAASPEGGLRSSSFCYRLI